MQGANVVKLSILTGIDSRPTKGQASSCRSLTIRSNSSGVWKQWSEWQPPSGRRTNSTYNDHHLELRRR